MKRLKLFSIILLLPLLFAGCKKESEITSPTNLNYDSPEFAIIDYSDAQNGIEEATLDSDMSFNPKLFGYSFMVSGDFKPGMGPMMKDLWMSRYDWNKHLGLILRKLNLTDEQKSKVADLMKAYHESMKPLVQQFRDANKAIVDSANAERKAIAQDLKDGKITRQEAMDKIKVLNEKTKKAIDENPVSVQIKKQMCDLTKKLLDDIKALLNTDQIAKWDNHVKNLKLPC
ncbi:MAG: Spy/CpxP family protein refolding chaperone [Stygiobacter sp.]